jgi:CheY-like chemotaxis protein
MDSKTIKVLLVEDNPVDVLLLREELSGLAGDNFIVSEVERLSEATQVLTTETFDVVLLDLGLPDSQGLDTFLELQKTTPDVPIVVMSGLDDESLAVEAVRKGAQDYLVKDKSDAFVLRRSIAYAIERQQLLPAQMHDFRLPARQLADLCVRVQDGGVQFREHLPLPDLTLGPDHGESRSAARGSFVDDRLGMPLADCLGKLSLFHRGDSVMNLSCNPENPQNRPQIVAGAAGLEAESSAYRHAHLCVNT